MAARAKWMVEVITQDENLLNPIWKCEPLIIQTTYSALVYPRKNNQVITIILYIRRHTGLPDPYTFWLVPYCLLRVWRVTSS